MSVAVTVCITCKFAADGDGERLAAALEAAAGARGAGPRIIRHSCLWACAHSCAVLIESDGRTGYLAGRLAPDVAAAGAVLDWCEVYGRTPDGQVPYGQWPDGMKGHFIARIPVTSREAE